MLHLDTSKPHFKDTEPLCSRGAGGMVFREICALHKLCKEHPAKFGSPMSRKLSTVTDSKLSPHYVPGLCKPLCPGFANYENPNRPGQARRSRPPQLRGGARRARLVVFFFFLNKRSRSQVAGLRSVLGPHFGKQCNGRNQELGKLLSSSRKLK